MQSVSALENLGSGVQAQACLWRNSAASGLVKADWRPHSSEFSHLLIFYSPDNGESWHPVAWNLKGEAYKVDTSFLPGGEAAKIWAIATDGFNTTEAVSSGTLYETIKQGLTALLCFHGSPHAVLQKQSHPDLKGGLFAVNSRDNIPYLRR